MFEQAGRASRPTRPVPPMKRNETMKNYLGVAGVLVIAAALIVGQPSAQAQTSFYQADAAATAGAPGSLIRNEKMDEHPYGAADKYRVLYRSTGLKGEPIAVSGMIFVPSGPMPKGGWPIVAWAHPTSGLVPQCAPSLARFGTDQVQGLETLAKLGYVVTATDYPGLGTPGPHPYLVGESEGRAVLDSIRAARELIGGASPDAAVWGHSQGGQATLYAAALAPTYAPDIKLVGVAAAAPATELQKLLDDDIGTPGGKNLLAMTLWSWNKVFGAPIEDVVTPTAMKTVDSLANLCSESIVDVLPRMAAGRALTPDFLKVDEITDMQPWKGIMEQNTIGTLPTDIPVMLVQGADDDTVNPAVTAGYMAEICKAGSKVTMLTIPKIGHLTVAKDGAPAFVDWLQSVRSGKPVADDCTKS
jgi:pimeloyl-ACP methyl ester carboxylesterase